MTQYKDLEDVYSPYEEGANFPRPDTDNNAPNNLLKVFFRHFSQLNRQVLDSEAVAGTVRWGHQVFLAHQKKG